MRLPLLALAFIRQVPCVATPLLRYAPLATLLQYDPLMNSKRVHCQRRQMNKGVRRRNAWTVEEMISPHCPCRIPALRVSTSVSRRREYNQLLPAYFYRQTGQTWRRFHCIAPAATRARLFGGRQRRRVRTKRSTRVRGGISNQTSAACRLLRLFAREGVTASSGKEE